MPFLFKWVSFIFFFVMLWFFVVRTYRYTLLHRMTMIVLLSGLLAALIKRSLAQKAAGLIGLADENTFLVFYSVLFLFYLFLRLGMGQLILDRKLSDIIQDLALRAVRKPGQNEDS